VVYIPGVERKFSSLEEYLTWRKEQSKARHKASIPRGEKHRRARVTEAQVVEMRRAYYSGAKTARRLAEESGLSISAVGSLLRGESWGHIREGLEQIDAELAKLKTPEEVAAFWQQRKLEPLKSGIRFTKLTEDQVRAIRAEYAAGGVLMKDLAEKYGVKTGTVCDIIARRTWKHI